MSQQQFQYLDDAGINLQAVFELNVLPESQLSSLTDAVDDISQFSHLLLLAHAGKNFWQQMKNWCQQNKERQSLTDPVDDYAQFKVEKFLQQQPSIKHFQLVYPSSIHLNLQAFGKLAGWHFDSPLRVGINHKWGTWFAYRAAVLFAGELQSSQQSQLKPVCSSCMTQACVSACPAKAISLEEYNIQACIHFRLTENSPCRDQCLARLACPVGKQHQYSKQQVNYHYGRSLATIRELY